MMDIARKRGVEIDLERLSRELGVPVVQSVAVRRGGTDALLGRDRPPARGSAAGAGGRLARARRRRAARRPARGRPRAARGGEEHGRARPRHGGGRPRAAASGGRPGRAARSPVRHVPGGVRLGATADGPDPGWLHLARHPGRGLAAARPAEELLQGRHHLRRRQRDRVPAADRHPVLLHPGAGGPGLHGPRGLPDGPHHGRRRPARARLHPAALVLRLRHPRNHVDPRDRRQARPAHHHPGGAA